MKYWVSGKVDGASWEDFFSDDGSLVTIHSESEIDFPAFKNLHPQTYIIIPTNVKTWDGKAIFDVVVHELNMDICKKAIAVINQVNPEDIEIEEKGVVQSI